MPVCVSYARTLSILAGAAALALAGAAQAGDGSVKTLKPNFTFSDGSHGFNLRTSGGAINPGIFVGFDPQPDPPGESETLLDITDGTSNTLYNPVGSGPYSFHLFHSIGDGSVAELNEPNADGFTSFRHLFRGHEILITMQFGPNGIAPGSWKSFNPQPDPPAGDGFAQTFEFLGGGGPAAAFGEGATDLRGRTDGFVTFSITVDGEALSLSAVPEPSTWAMMLLGFGGAGAILRNRRRSLAAA